MDIQVNGVSPGAPAEVSAAGRVADDQFGVELLQFARVLCAASSRAELQKRFNAGFGRLFGLPMWGLYTVDGWTGRPVCVASMGVSDTFVARYERGGRELNWLQEHLDATGRAVYNLALMPMEEWLADPLYTMLKYLHDIRHEVQAPVVNRYGVVGTLHAGTCEPDRGFTPYQLRLIEALARVTGTAIEGIDTRAGLARERDLAVAALDGAGAAVVITDPAASGPRPNEAARCLLAEVVDAERELNRVTTGPGTGGGRGFSRHVVVELVDGGSGLLHGHSTHTRDELGSLVTVLELQRDHAEISTPTLTALTPREREVALLVVDGRSDREIARRLHLPPHRQPVRQTHLPQARRRLPRHPHPPTPRTPRARPTKLSDPFKTVRRSDAHDRPTERTRRRPRRPGDSRHRQEVRTAMITGVSKVMVPVDDQQAALDFWTTTMGFSVARDETYGDERWIEVAPPQQRLLLALTPREAGVPRRTVPERLPHSDIFFNCADIEQTHAELSARGVRFPLPPSRQQFGWWALFEDNEGTRYALGQWDDDAINLSEAITVAQHDDIRPTDQPRTPDPALRRLDFLVGTWRIEGETVAGFTGPQLRSLSTETFEWLDGGFFLEHRWDAVFGEPGEYPGRELPGGAVQRGVMFYGFDAATGRFRTHFFDGNGPFHEGSMYEGGVVDGGLRFTGPARFTLVEQPDGTVTNDWELRDDNGEWRPWRHTTMTRIG